MRTVECFFLLAKKGSQELKYLSKKKLKLKVFCLLILGTTVMIWSKTLCFVFLVSQTWRSETLPCFLILQHNNLGLRILCFYF